MTPVPAARRPVRRHFIKFLLAGLLLAAGVVSAVVAQAPAERTRAGDDVVALRVRQALADHPSLAPHKLNLLVTVIDGVAVVGGAVPDERLSRTIETAAAKVDGVARVKVTVWVTPPAQNDPLAARLGDKLNPRPAPPPQPAVTLSVPGDPRPTGSVTARTTPVPSVLQPPVQSAERTSRAPHVRPPGAEPPEYTPIPATNLPTEPVVEPPPVRAAAPREPEADAWKRDPRFAKLTVEVRNGTAVIGGRATTHTAAWDLADEVRNWPTVERVVVGRVDVK
jgi:hypothetical protein